MKNPSGYGVAMAMLLSLCTSTALAHVDGEPHAHVDLPWLPVPMAAGELAWAALAAGVMLLLALRWYARR